MTLKQQRDKDMEEFDKNFPEPRTTSTQPSGFTERQQQKTFIDQIYINIAKGEIDRLETQRTPNGTEDYEIGYSQAIDQEYIYW